ncbi:MAG: glycosyltransferase [Gammaproteobacteria bacterium]|nr:glycosyltransferase [Gammaproteobacteria bacterium]
MRVLQFGRFYPPSRGGIESAIYHIREGLAGRGVRCDVLCCNKTRSASRETVAGGVIYRAAWYGSFLSLPLAPGLFTRLAKIAAGYDVICLHHPDPSATLALFLARLPRRIKVVVHWHSDIVRQKAMLPLFLPLQRWLLRRAAAVIVSTPAYVRSAHLASCRGKVAVVPIGIEDVEPRAGDADAAAVRARYPGRFLVFAMGRLVYYKGFEYLIEAAVHLHESVNILIGGDGPCRRALRRRIEQLGLSARVFLPGALSEREVAGHYRACDAFCLSSTLPSEAFGVVQVEAMCFAKPVVATIVPGSGVSWVNADRVSGFNVPPRDPRALARALDVLRRDPALARRLGEHGRRRFEEMFTRDRMCERLQRIYGEGLNQPAEAA